MFVPVIKRYQTTDRNANMSIRQADEEDKQDRERKRTEEDEN
jgi:hypothetical protein